MDDIELDKYLRQIRGTVTTECVDLIDEGEKILDDLYKIFKSKGKRSDAPEKTMRALRRVVHNLKCIMSTSRAIKRFPALSVISYRLEDYLTSIDKLTHAQTKDIFKFFEFLRAALKMEESAPVAEMVRELPIFRSAPVISEHQQKFSESLFPNLDTSPDGKPMALEAVLIMPSGKLHRRIVEQSLDSCGFRITNVSSSTQAIDIVLDIKPDIILSSQVIDDMLTGVELARIFALLPQTKDTPFILLTSFAKQSKELRSLPQTTKIARKDKNFLDDFAACLLNKTQVPG